MKRILIDLQENSYPIVLTDRFCGLAKELKDLGTHQKIMVITEPKIRALYGEQLEEELKDFSLTWHEIDGGEDCKTLTTVSGIYESLMRNRFDRKGTLLALGGGIVGDITGFAAASFMRGISFVQVPTTLLAQVDSSVGGKTGVNFHSVKNIIGAFYQPKLVFANLKTLETLSVRDYKTGLGEVAKYAVLEGEPLYSDLMTHKEEILARDSGVLAEIVGCCCEIKAKIVAQDEREQGLRAVLNLGHTFGHAYETATNHEIYHGEAVSLGMISACRAAECMGLFHRSEDVITLIRTLGLMEQLPQCDKDTILTAMKGDKKQEDGKLKFVLPLDLGNVQVRNDVPKSAVLQGLEAIWKK